MGILETNNPFSTTDLNNRDLIIKMLKYEDTIYKSEIGQNAFKSFGLGQLEPLLVINRMTLIHFGFNTDDNSFYTYYLHV